MSNDISYVIKITDDFSANLKKFQSGLKGVDQQVASTARNINQASIASKFFTQNLIDLGKATGLYIGFQQVKNFALGIYETRKQMDGLEASLSAILPKFDKTKSGTSLATDEINYLREATNKLGVSFKDVLPAYVQLISNSPFKLKETRDIFEAFAGYGRLNALTGEQQKQVMFAIQQMMGKRKIQAQEFNQQLKPVMPGAADIFDRALKRFTKGTPDEKKTFDKLMEEGRIGAGLLKEVAKILQEDYGEAMIKKSHTLGGEVARVSNAFQEFQTILSVMFAPAMRASALASAEFFTALKDVFKGIDDQSTFIKQTDDLQGLITALRVGKGMLEGFGKELALIGKIASTAFGLAFDVIRGTTIAGYALFGGDKEIARESFSELGQQMKNRFTEPQQAQVDIYHHNTPRGTRVETRPSNNPNLKTGNIVDYNNDNGGYD